VRNVFFVTEITFFHYKYHGVLWKYEVKIYKKKEVVLQLEKGGIWEPQDSSLKTYINIPLTVGVSESLLISWNHPP